MLRPPPPGPPPGTPGPLVPGLSLRAGDVLTGRYRVERLIGCEASGVTFAARRVHGREPVTLEVLAGYSDTDRVDVEARVARARRAAHLTGNRVARVLDIGATPDGMPFVVTTRPTGRTLETFLAARGPLDVPTAVLIALEVCDALSEAHALGLVHGDLEPRRVLVADDGGVTVLGFGVARASASVGDASASTWFGSPSYLAPEHVRAEEVDAQADVWSVGVLLHEMLSGAPPFEGESVPAVLVAVAFDAAPLVTEAPYDLAALVARCLAKDPTARPQGVLELARALAPFAAARGAAVLADVERTDAGARRRATRVATRRRPVAAAAPAEPPPRATLQPFEVEGSGVGARVARTVRSRRLEHGRRPQRARVAVLLAAALGLIGALASARLLTVRPGQTGQTGQGARDSIEGREVAPFRPNVAAPAVSPSLSPGLPVAAASLPSVPSPRPAARATPSPSPSPSRAPGAPSPGHTAVAAPGPLVRTPPWPLRPPATRPSTPALATAPSADARQNKGQNTRQPPDAHATARLSPARN